MPARQSTWLILLIATASAAASGLEPHEQIIFFNTWAWQDPGGGRWNIPIHGWIFQPKREHLSRKMVLKTFEKLLDVEGSQERRIFRDHAGWMLVDSKRGERLKVQVGSQTYAVGTSRPNGHFRTTVYLTPEELRPLVRTDRHGRRWLSYKAVTPPGDDREFTGRVELLADTGLMVISDIDDTIRLAGIGDHEKVFTRTFLRELVAVPGMAALYSRWASKGASFYFASESPWALYPLLTDFMQREGFPEASFALKDWRLSDLNMAKIFADPQDMKPPKIKPLLKQFPRRHFILVGDSSEKDPEIFGTLAREYPDRSIRILIRSRSSERSDTGRFERAFTGLPRGSWATFEREAELAPFAEWYPAVATSSATSIAPY